MGALVAGCGGPGKATRGSPGVSAPAPDSPGGESGEVAARPLWVVVTEKNFPLSETARGQLAATAILSVGTKLDDAAQVLDPEAYRELSSAATFDERVSKAGSQGRDGVLTISVVRRSEGASPDITVWVDRANLPPPYLPQRVRFTRGPDDRSDQLEPSMPQLPKMAALVLGEPPPRVGKLDPARAQAVLDAGLKGVRLCYGGLRRRYPQEAMKVAVTLRVEEDGKVSRSLIAHASRRDDLVERCVIRRTREWVFDPPRGGFEIVHVTVDLEPKGAADAEAQGSQEDPASAPEGP